MSSSWDRSNAPRPGLASATGAPATLAGKRTLIEALPPVQAKAAGAPAASAEAPAAAAPSSPISIAAMGDAFGADFSSVQVHRDGRAEAMGAQALAQGDDIHLAPGKGDLASAEGRALIGHELAHVVQQREGRVSSPQGKDAPVVADQRLEDEADRAGAAIARGEPVPTESRARGGTGAAAAPQRKADDQPIQLFEGMEHKAAGDDGSGHSEYVWSSEGAGKPMKPHEAQDQLPTKRTPLKGTIREPAMCDLSKHVFEFRLTHGDLTMISGDLFDPRDKDEQGHVIPDSLFKLAATPSSEPGRQVGTQDEIIYAIYRENPGDIRFNHMCTVEQPGAGAWAEYPKRFSSEVKAAVESRYLRLAAHNRDHFVQPDWNQKGRGGIRDSAGGAYRGLHEQAIELAYQAGRHKQNAGEAFAREAAAEHFLTDAFSAGHLRTPRSSMQRYWDAKYPRFYQSFVHVLEQGVSTALESQTNVATVLAPDALLEHVVHGKVQKMLAGVPPLTFGDVLGKIVHDVDNDQGLWVINELGQTWKAYGDGNMYKDDPANLTAEKSRLAVSLGTDDIFSAELLGILDAGQAERTPEQLFADVKAHARSPAKPGASYAPEQVMPHPDPARIQDNGTQMTTASGFDDLWSLQIRTDQPETYGDKINAALKPGGVFYGELAAKGAGLDETSMTTHPRAAFQAFLDRLASNPYFWMYYILDGAK
jgi:hypothetical protein